MKENDKFKKLSDVPKKYTGKCFITSIHEEHIYYKGLLHNTKGPAVATKNSKQYWHKGSLHRLDGPADYFGTTEEYYIHNVKYEPNDYWKHPLVVKTKLDRVLSL